MKQAEEEEEVDEGKAMVDIGLVLVQQGRKKGGLVVGVFFG